MDFTQASKRVNQLSKRPDNETLLQLYALYKQGTDGDVTGRRPGMMDLKGRAKWDAWKQLEGMDTGTAQSRYVKLVEALIRKDK